MIKINKLKTQIFLDGANFSDIQKFKEKKYITGFTTNPSLMKEAGVKNYKNFCLKILNTIKKKDVSFEIFADDLKNIEFQAREIASWGKNIYVKIPVINTQNKCNSGLIGKLNNDGIKINVTAVFTLDQTKRILKKIDKKTPCIISIFAGRIADTGVDPLVEIKKHIMISKKYPNVKILWASVREPFNIMQANQINCHIITVPPSILKKLKVLNKNLEKYSIETVKMFYKDAKESGFKI